MKVTLTTDEKKERKRKLDADYRARNREKLRLKQADRRMNDIGYRILDNIRRAESIKITRSAIKAEKERLHWTNYEQSAEYIRVQERASKVAWKICRASRHRPFSSKISSKCKK
jgi:hypothetical protein